MKEQWKTNDNDVHDFVLIIQAPRRTAQTAQTAQAAQAQQQGQVAMDPYAAGPPFTVKMALLAIGFDTDKSERLADELFCDTFQSCKDKSNEDLKDNFKSLTALKADDGGIQFTPKQKDGIYAFVHWVKDLYRRGRDPLQMIFPVAEITQIKAKARSHKAYVDRYETVSTAAKPERFTKDTKWEDWAPSFLNYIRCIPGREGVPLLYVARDSDLQDNTPKMDFLDEYIASAPLNGDAFMSDADQVHVYLVNLVAQNEEAESVIKLYEKERNGRKDWKALKLHYEGQGLYALDVTKAEKDIKNLFYQGEKKPHMYWLEFERRLNLAFAVLAKSENRLVYSDQMKLRTLLDKVHCDWLGNVKASIGIELTRIPMTYTYAQAMLAFKTAVHKKFPPGASPARIRRTIYELEGKSGNNNRGDYYGRGRGGGRGRSQQGRGRGRGGRGRGNRNYPRSDAKTITLKNGKRIDYHPAYSFPIDIYSQFTDEQIETLKRERREYKQKTNTRSDGSKRTIQALQAELDELKSIVSSVSNQIPESIKDGSASTISQMTTNTRSIMGGRNEQQSKRRKKYDGDSE